MLKYLRIFLLLGLVGQKSTLKIQTSSYIHTSSKLIPREIITGMLSDFKFAIIMSNVM